MNKHAPSKVREDKACGEEARETASSRRVRLADALDWLAYGFAFYYLTSLVVLVGGLFAVDFVPVCGNHPGSQTRVDLVSSFAAWDGEWYVRIAAAGYSYDPDRMSSVAFFPLYPCLAGAIVHSTGMRPEWALLLVSHGALVAAFVVFGAYVQQRFPGADWDLVAWTLLALGLFPTTFYYRMAYTESTFLLLTLLAMYGSERGWRPVWIALVIGLATATRTVGVGLVPVFALYLWRQLAGATNGEAGRIEAKDASASAGGGLLSGFSRGSRVASRPAGAVRGLAFSWLWRCVAWSPVCCWGLLAYMTYQWIAFGEPLAFVKTQAHWNERSVDLVDRIIGPLTLEPIRAVYDPSSSCYWANVPPRGNLLFNLKAANPAYFLAAITLVGVGAWKRWLNAPELLLSVTLLAIPYFLQAMRSGMSGQARYAAVVFPMYLVLGQLLHRAPPPLAAAVLAISGLFLAVYSAMFVSWYWYY